MAILRGDRALNPHDAFERVLALLHDAALDDARWSDASALIEEAVGTRGSVLTVGERSGAEVSVFFNRLRYRGEDRHDLAREYFEVYQPIDEGPPRLWERHVGQLIHVPDMYTETELRTSAAFNEGWGTLDGRNGVITRLDFLEGLSTVYGVSEPVDGDGWGSAQVALLESLLPHVRHFVRVRQALAAADALGTSLTGLLDNSRIGVAHLDRSGRVTEANAPALAVLRAGDGLFNEDGTLHARLPEDQKRLQRLLRRALPSLWGESPRGGSMTVGRTSERARLGLHVSPVGNAGADFGARRVAVLVLVVDPADAPRIDPVQVSRILGLSPSEGRVAALLAEGRSVPETAAAAGYQTTYVRWLIQRIYKKQGVSGQVALVRRVLAASALLRR